MLWWKPLEICMQKKSHKGKPFFFLPENKLLGKLSKHISSISKVSTTKHLLWGNTLRRVTRRRMSGFSIHAYLYLIRQDRKQGQTESSVLGAKDQDGNWVPVTAFCLKGTSTGVLILSWPKTQPGTIQPPHRRSPNKHCSFLPQVVQGIGEAGEGGCNSGWKQRLRVACGS